MTLKQGLEKLRREGYRFYKSWTRSRQEEKSGLPPVFEMSVWMNEHLVQWLNLSTMKGSTAGEALMTDQSIEALTLGYFLPGTQAASQGAELWEAAVTVTVSVRLFLSVFLFFFSFFLNNSTWHSKQLDVLKPSASTKVHTKQF